MYRTILRNTISLKIKKYQKEYIKIFLLFYFIIENNHIYLKKIKIGELRGIKEEIAIERMK